MSEGREILCEVFLSQGGYRKSWAEVLTKLKDMMVRGVSRVTLEGSTLAQSVVAIHSGVGMKSSNPEIIKEISGYLANEGPIL